MKNLKDYTIKNNNGEDFSFYDYQGDSNLIILFFRGAWCNYCKKQLQDIQNHIDDLKKLNIRFVAISSDSKMNSSILKTFLNLSFPVLSDSDFTIIDAFNLRVMYKDKEVSKPAVYLFNADHKETFKLIGDTYDDRISAKELLPRLKEILNSQV